MHKEKIAFLGLGKIGYQLAGHIAQNDFDINVWNRTSAKAEAWEAEYEGKKCRSIKQAVKDRDIVLVCVGADDDLEEVLLSEEGALRFMKKNSLLIDHTTASVEIAKKLAKEVNNMSISFVDAPVSGGEVGARNGTLTIMVGGSIKDYEKSLPIFELYSSAVSRMGVAGSGQLMKMVNQIAHAGTIQALAESLNFGKKMGLDMKKAINVMKNGAARTWHLENRGETMLKDKFDFGFANKHMEKDLSLAINEAEKNGIDLPITKQVDKYYRKLLEKRMEDLDFSSIIKLLNK